MATIMKVRCNGPGQHVNDVDLDVVLLPTVVLRGAPAPSERQIPERLALSCGVCTVGKVIIERAAIEERRRAFGLTTRASCGPNRRTCGVRTPASQPACSRRWP